MSANVEMIEIGIDTAEISVVRQLARKKKITRLASRLPSTRWCSSDEIAAWMKTDWSLLIRTRMSDGSAACSAARRALTSSAVATVFCPDCFWTTSVTDGRPFRNEALRSSSCASTASPMSLSRTT